MCLSKSIALNVREANPQDFLSPKQKCFAWRLLQSIHFFLLDYYVFWVSLVHGLGVICMVLPDWLRFSGPPQIGDGKG